MPEPRKVLVSLEVTPYWRVSGGCLSSLLQFFPGPRDARRLVQLLVEERHGPAPGEVRGLRVVFERWQFLRVRRLVREGVLGVVAVEFELHTGLAQLRLQLVHAVDGKEPVACAPVAEQRRLDLGGVDILERRIAVPHDGGVVLGDVHRREQRERTAHAESGHAHLRAARTLEVLHGAADVLPCRIAEVEVVHQVPGLFRLHGFLAAIEIRHERPVSRCGELVRNPLDLIVEAPPLLDNHDTRRTVAPRRLHEIALSRLAVRPLEADHFAHVVLRDECMI